MVHKTCLTTITVAALVVVVVAALIVVVVLSSSVRDVLWFRLSSGDGLVMLFLQDHVESKQFGIIGNIIVGLDIESWDDLVEQDIVVLVEDIRLVGKSESTGIHLPAIDKLVSRSCHRGCENIDRPRSQLTLECS